VALGSEDSVTDNMAEFAVNSEGPAGESIFFGLSEWGLGKAAGELEPKLQQELSRVHDVKDDRLMVLLGSLVIENAVEGLLAAFMPGLAELRDKPDFSFSLKIAVARATRLVPSRVLGAADIIRSIRNEFVHNLEIDSFERIPPKLLSSMAGHLKEFNRTNVAITTTLDQFYHLVVATTMTLYLYAHQVKALDSYVRSGDLGPHLEQFVGRERPA